MPTMSLPPCDLPRLAELCAAQDPRAGLEALAMALGERMPDASWTPVLTRGGWHRLGGVVDARHRRVAEQIHRWAETESGGDLDRLLERHGDAGYLATRLAGKTHYLTAPLGPEPWNFAQLEVEEIQETVDRLLIDPEQVPEDLEELVDPLEAPRLEPIPIGPPRYLFRRCTFMPEMLARAHLEPALTRFLTDWGRSSAGESGPFCAAWVLVLRESMGSGGEARVGLKPVSTRPESPPRLQVEDSTRGARLANLLHAFDREVGYHFAWYFTMLSSPQVPHRVADLVHADLQGAYAYLPARDLRVLREWHAHPYGV